MTTKGAAEREMIQRGKPLGEQQVVKAEAPVKQSKPEQPREQEPRPQKP